MVVVGVPTDVVLVEATVEVDGDVVVDTVDVATVDVSPIGDVVG